MGSANSSYTLADPKKLSSSRIHNHDSVLKWLKKGGEGGREWQGVGDQGRSDHIRSGVDEPFFFFYTTPKTIEVGAPHVHKQSLITAGESVCSWRVAKKGGL